MQFTPFLLGICAAACCSVAGAAPRKPDVARVEALVVEGTNDFRVSQSRGTVKRNRDLEQTARDFAEYLARTGKLDHDADGSTPAARATRHGYDYCYVAENISRQYSTAGFTTAELARELVEGWKNSPGHRKNLLEAEVLDTAVAVAHRTHNGYEDYYAVQLFGRPKSARIEFQVRNAASSPLRYRIGERAFTLAPRHAQIHTECAVPNLSFEGVSGGRITALKGDKLVVTPSGGALSLRRE